MKHLTRLTQVAVMLTSASLLAACSSSVAPETAMPATSEPAAEAAATQPSESMQPSEGMSYTLSQISEHASAEDCWMAIEGKVYDVTPMITAKQHPGGAAVLEGCGIDATELFNTRPMGSGTAHSERANEGLERFYIGELATE